MSQLTFDFNCVEEIYKDVEGFEGLYKVSNYGKVLSVRNKKFLKPDKDKNGYEMVKLAKQGSITRDKVHRIVFFSFNSGVPRFYHVNHKNKIKDDNRLENLESVTIRENNTHRCMGIKKTSRFTGVNFDKKAKKWRATIIYNRKSKFLGYFKCETAAHFAYIKEIKKQNITNKYA